VVSEEEVQEEPLVVDVERDLAVDVETSFVVLPIASKHEN
jgi:hypothetical protein